MKVLTLLLMFSLGLMGNYHPYKKEISFESITKSTLVRVKLDKEVYENTEAGYGSIRLKSLEEEEGYFIGKEQVESVQNFKSLKVSSYERDKARLNYQFKEPFEVEELKLNIEDRNFESLVDVYVNGVLVSKANKIFDYSNETGTRNFSIKIDKEKVKELSLVYHIDKTTAFYKKYKNIRQQRQYLSIKSVEFLNTKKEENLLEKHYVKLLSFKTKDKVSSYIFKVDQVPSEELEFLIGEKNFKRKAKLYASNDLEEFSYLNHFSIFSSSFNDYSNLKVNLKNRSRYLKVEVENRDNKPLTFIGLNIFMKPNYLYFIAEATESYTLYFGDESLDEPSYELKSIVSKKDVYEVGTFSKLEKLNLLSTVNEVAFLKKHKETLFIVLILMVLGLMSYIAFTLLDRVRVE